MARNRRKLDRAQLAADMKATGSRFLRVLLGIATVGAIGTAAVYGGTFGYRWVTTSQTFAINAITIAGNRRAGSDELVRLSGLVPGRNLFLSDVEAAEHGIAQQPWVKTVEVHRRLPNAVQVRVTEREPALVVDLGKLYFADPDGTLFKRALGGDDLDLPVVTGLSRDGVQGHGAEVQTQLRDLAAFAADYRARGLDAKYRLEELNLDAADGLTAQLSPRDQKGELQTVKLGDAPYGDKLEKLSTLWSEFERRGVKAAVVHLDNRARPNWVAVKLALGDTH